jgi:hypothetical protein
MFLFWGIEYLSASFSATTVFPVPDRPEIVTALNLTITSFYLFCNASLESWIGSCSVIRLNIIGFLSVKSNLK